VLWRILSVTCLALILMIEPSNPVWAQDDADNLSDIDTDPYALAVQEARANMMANPPAALGHAEVAESLVIDYVLPLEQGEALATAWWLQAEALTRLARPTEAQPIAQRALDQLGDTPQRTKLYADILLSLGRTNKVLGHHGQALETFQRAFDVYRELGQTRSQSIILQSIGSIYTDARQYQRAVEYYTDAVELYQDPSLDLSAYNNLANVFTELGRRDEALDYFTRSLVIAQEMESAMLEARILNNTASMHVVFGEFEAAEASAILAFERAGDPSGAEWARFMWGVRAQAVSGQGRHREARSYIERTFDGVTLSDTSQHFTKFHGAASSIYEALGDYEAALPHLQAFKRLEDESREFAASANTALVGAQFDFTQQELQIEQLRIQGLEQDFALSRSQARQRMFVAVGLLALSIIIVIGVIMRHRTTKERERALEQALYNDAETGLPSRQGLARNLKRETKLSGMRSTIIAFKIKRNSHLESVLGFAKFAELEFAIAQRLETMTDAENVALISSGVLGVKLEQDDESEIVEIAEKMRECLVAPFQLDNLDIDISVIAGVASHEDSDLCVKNAMIAVQQAEEAHQTCASYDAEKYGDPSENLTLMSRMLAAIQNGEMSLHYQPKLHLRSGTYLAAEALCRWNDSERGNITPDEFIPQAEETGHIRAFTEWSITQTIRDQRLLHYAGFDINLAVNISGALLDDDDFARTALDIALQAPGSVSFEITETAMMQDTKKAIANLHKWSDAGIKLAIDDYGSGLSSLGYIKEIPSNELKLDRVFVTDVASSNRDRMLVKSTVDLAHNLGLEMTAEGVETEEGLALLKLLGCDWAQGFVLSKALPLEELIKFLREMEDLAPKTDSVDQPEDRHGDIG